MMSYKDFLEEWDKDSTNHGYPSLFSTTKITTTEPEDTSVSEAINALANDDNIYYTALKSALDMMLSVGSASYSGKRQYIRMRDDRNDINITIEYTMPDNYKITDVKEGLYAMAMFLNTDYKKMTKLAKYKVTVTKKKAVSSDDKQVRYGWEYAYPFINNIYYLVHNKTLVEDLNEENCPTEEDILEILNRESKTEEVIETIFGDKHVIKKEPDVKIYRTEITDTNDPYWKAIEKGWTVK